MEEVNKKAPIRPILNSLKVDESYAYPCSRMCTVKSVASTLKAVTGMVYKTKLEKPLFHIMRIK